MKIKELHKDIERYLSEDCYCANEIYDMTGFFYRLFTKDDECKLLGEKKEKTEKSSAFIACVSDDQIILFYPEEDKIVGAERFDATENNIKIICDIINKKDVSDCSIDEFKKGDTKKNLDNIMKYADAIMVS